LNFYIHRLSPLFAYDEIGKCDADSPAQCSSGNVFMGYLSLTGFWIGIGLLLCALELIFPTAFVELVMGLSALIIAFASLLVPSFAVQIILWLILSLIGVFSIRRILPRKLPKVLRNAQEARTLTMIAPGEKGRVQYEGSPWAARCPDETQAIAPGTRVIVVDREGTTLLVMPVSVFDSEED
jgi:membrane protein implicated in regulation of membrane protease activity